MKILYLGPCPSENALRTKQPLSVAAARWSNGFLETLCKHADVYVITHCEEAAFPHSRVIWQGADHSLFVEHGLCGKFIGYVNLPILKNWYLSCRYQRAVQAVCRKEHIDVLVCYNLALRPFYLSAMRKAKKLGVKCVPIILDGYDPRIDNWRSILSDTKQSDGLVFLSQWMVDHFPVNKPRLHMTGGVDKFNGDKEKVCKGVSDIVKIVHTGGLDLLRGGAFLREVLSKYSRKNVRFILCGKCMNNMLAKDERVEQRGFISESELNRLSESATVFISVSDPKNGQNAINFPSKLLRYLSWGVPVVSTWLESYSPDFQQVLQTRCITVDEFISRLDEVIGFTPDDRCIMFEKTKKWFERNLTWEVQINRLLVFLENLINVGKGDK